ncbi:tyrosine-protein kinase receptor torso [Danaus plexippus plexippus]|uniref:receptor protein-tyrosine kinase n=1 Tax=Danaus plexippus plexippus TaxID=278856 RepID=A0A212FKB6_DANPL|nr:tyrosine-protein kinase receptor torso [Danaus plexippus plexippus]
MTVSQDKKRNVLNEIDVKIKCQSNTTVLVSVPSSKESILVVLVNDKETTIGEEEEIPGQNNTALITQLPLDDSCTIIVNGAHGVTNLTYRTPSCFDLAGCSPWPEVAENVTLDAIERGSGWSVLVKWSPPRHQPSYYNISLQADEVYRAIVPGNQTEAQFDHVTGTGEYEVLMRAKIENRTATTSRWDIFPPRSGGAAGVLVAAALLILATVLLAALLCWRRRIPSDSHNFYIPGLHDKFPESCDTDVGGPESGSEDTWEVRPERLLLHEVIGEGAFGVVRRGTLAPANKDVAVKMLKEYPSVEEVRSFRAEMELMKSVGAHPHVVSLLGCCSGRRPLIVAEYCSRGDLLTYLRCSWDMMVSRRNAKYYNNNNKENYRNDLFKSKLPDMKFVANRLYDIQGVCDTELTMLDLLSFCRQIAMGMEFLASNRVVHRDLAARNILVTADRTLKIADFGLSRDVYQENQYKQKGNGKMPVKWMALESLTHRIFTTQSDVWSFGVVVWEVVTVGGAPYAGVGAARLPRLLAAGYRMPCPHNCGPQLYELMLSCWRDRPRCRPTFTELVSRLDALLCASADHYLSLSLPLQEDSPEVPSTTYRYMRMLLRGKLRGKSYERPLAPTNHYTQQPAPTTHTPP